MKRQFISLLCVIFCMACTRNQPEEQLPNIILILADDMGYGDPGCYNPDSKIPTPGIDKMAEEGMRFTDAHSPSAVCSPTRYGILTGRFAWRTRLKRGVLGPYSKPLIEENRLTLPKMLKEKGYHTACIGKWHLGMQWGLHHPEDTLPALWDPQFDQSKIDLSAVIAAGPLTAGFDSYFGTAVPNFPPYCFIENDHVLGAIPQHLKPDTIYGNPGLMQEGWDLHNILPGLKQRALEYIDEQAVGDANPFFLYIPLTAPHTPIVPNSEYLGMSGAGDYGDLVVEVDALVGAVMEQLERHDLSENTLLIFTSDNGSPARAGDPHIRDQDWAATGAVERLFGHNPNTPWRGMKADIFEGGHRVPLIIRWPGHLASGAVNEHLTGSIDIMATLATLVDFRLPEEAAGDSHDMYNTWMDPSIPARDILVHHSAQGMFAIREGKWKLIEGQGSGGWTKVDMGENESPGQLYDLSADPLEQHNLYDDQPQIVEHLSALLQLTKLENKPVASGN